MNQIQRDGIDVLLILSHSSANQVDKFVQQHNIKFQVLCDPYSSVAHTYNVRRVPAPFLIDSEGIIVWSGPIDGPEIWSILAGTGKTQIMENTSSIDAGEVQLKNGGPPCGDNFECYCGDTLISDYTLPADLNCVGDGLFIGQDNITLDCNGYSIRGVGND